MTNNEQDSLIISAILQANETVARVRRGDYVHNYHSSQEEYNYHFSQEELPRWPSCAVGAGLLFAGMQAWEIACSIKVPEAFAKWYGVSVHYAVGVSDGFEACIGKTSSLVRDASSLPRLSKPHRADYLRGWAVGEAVYDAVTSGLAP